MAEYIEREAENYWCECCCNFDKANVGMDAMALCKLTGCLAYCQEYGGNCKGFNVPAADVVEVVRCKDCKYLEITLPYGECSRYLRMVSPNDFCSCGERKDGADNDR